MKKRDVENIPYHIIIYKILPFIELTITKENHTQDFIIKNAFGYFSRDRCRKIFLIRKSIFFSRISQRRLWIPQKVINLIGWTCSLFERVPEGVINHKN